MKITKISDNAVKILEHFECEGNVNQPKFLNAYLDSCKIPTIGIGTTIYPNGIKVKIGDKCTVAQAYEYCKHDISYFEKRADLYTDDDVTQEMFDAIVIFLYNVGETNYKASTLLKLINANPKDYVNIEFQWNRWNKGNVDGKLTVLGGLTRRRKSEFNLYKTGTINFFLPKK